MKRAPSQLDEAADQVGLGQLRMGGQGALGIAQGGPEAPVLQVLLGEDQVRAGALAQLVHARHAGDGRRRIRGAFGGGVGHGSADPTTRVGRRRTPGWGSTGTVGVPYS